MLNFVEVMLFIDLMKRKCVESTSAISEVHVEIIAADTNCD